MSPAPDQPGTRAKPDDGIKKAWLDILEPIGSPRAPSPSASKRIIFWCNPNQYTIAMSANWKHEPKKEESKPEFTGTQPRTLTLEMFLDDRLEQLSRSGDVASTVNLLFSCMEPTEKTRKAKNPVPPFVQFGWGRTVLFKAYVTSVSAKYTRFDADGRPNRAICSVTLKEFQLEIKLQNPTSGTPEASRVHQVVQGDTLASIAFAEYGRADIWRALATVNGIDNPSDLKPGRRLLLPDELPRS